MSRAAGERKVVCNYVTRAGEERGIDPLGTTLEPLEHLEAPAKLIEDLRWQARYEAEESV